jgi:hypothetical protein
VIDQDSYAGISPYNVVTFYYKGMVAVHFRVGEDSAGLGEVSEPIDVDVYKGTVASVNGSVITLTYNGKQAAVDVATPIDTEKYVRSFDLWNCSTGDRSPDYVEVILEETWYYAHFDQTGKPVQVEIKYVSEGLPIAIDGKNLDWVSGSYFGKDVSINYKQNLSADTAKKLDDAYVLARGYVVIPSDPTDQGETVKVLDVDSDTVVIQFEFDKNATYMQRYMVYADGASLPFPVAEMPEAYGLDATVTVTATDPADVPKNAKVRIGDDKGTFYGVGQTGTYNGHTYKVVKGDSGKSSDVKVMIDGEINVCSQSSPLLFYYQFV